MILKGRGISEGKISGKVTKVSKRVSFLGDVSPEDGTVFGDKEITGSIFVFPEGKGSTVGSYVIYQLKKNSTAPIGMINEISETIVASGSIISDIPLVDKIDIDLIDEGDRVKVDGHKGEVELKDVEMIDVVTAFLKKGDHILLVKRSDKVGTFKNKWAGVSGYLEDEPLKQAKKEIREETKLDGDIIYEGEPVKARDKDTIWKVHPFLFEVRDDPELDWENERYEWVEPLEIKRRDTVPKLWDAFLSARCSDESKDR